ncbi:MAG: hypothetical protein ACFFGZ_10335 [Candidatus Thorarchaeota archaeon]
MLPIFSKENNEQMKNLSFTVKEGEFEEIIFERRRSTARETKSILFEDSFHQIDKESNVITGLAHNRGIKITRFENFGFCKDCSSIISQFMDSLTNLPQRSAIQVPFSLYKVLEQPHTFISRIIRFLQAEKFGETSRFVLEYKIWGKGLPSDFFCTLTISSIDRLLLLKQNEIRTVSTSILGSDHWSEIGDEFNVLIEQINGLDMEIDQITRKCGFFLQDIYQFEDEPKIAFRANLAANPHPKLSIGFSSNMIGDIKSYHRLFLVQDNDWATVLFLCVAPLSLTLGSPLSGHNKWLMLQHPVSTPFLLERDMDLMDLINKLWSVGFLHIPFNYEEEQILQISSKFPRLFSTHRYSPSPRFSEFLSQTPLKDQPVDSLFESVVIFPNDPVIALLCSPFARYVKGFPILNNPDLISSEINEILKKPKRKIVYVLDRLEKQVLMELKERALDIRLIANQSGKKKKHVKLLFDLANEFLKQVCVDHTISRYQILEKEKANTPTFVIAQTFKDDLIALLKKYGIHRKFLELARGPGNALEEQLGREQLYKDFPLDAIKWCIPSLMLNLNYLGHVFGENPPLFQFLYYPNEFFIVETHVSIQTAMAAAQLANARMSPIIPLVSIPSKLRTLFQKEIEASIQNITNARSVAEANRYFCHFEDICRSYGAQVITKKHDAFFRHFDIMPEFMKCFNKGKIPSRYNTIKIKRPLKQLSAHKATIFLYLNNNNLPIETILKDNNIPQFVIGRMTTNNPESDQILHFGALFGGSGWTSHPKWLLFSTTPGIRETKIFWDLFCKGLETIGDYALLGAEGNVPNEILTKEFQFADFILIWGHGDENYISLGKESLEIPDILELASPMKRRIIFLNSCSTGRPPQGGMVDENLVSAFIFSGASILMAPFAPVPVHESLALQLFILRNGQQDVPLGFLLRSAQASNSYRGFCILNSFLIYGDPTFRPFRPTLDKRKKLMADLDEIFVGFHVKEGLTLQILEKDSQA